MGLVRKLFRRARFFISRYPLVYLPLVKLRNNSLVVSSETELVLEGFPRCGNSFAEAALRLPQPNDLNLAHHCHAGAQIVFAARKKIPCVILIRDPLQSVASWCVKEPNFMSPSLALREYYDFYRIVDKHLDGCVLVSFETVVKDFSAAISEINEKFSMDLCNWPENKVDDNLVMEEVSRLNSFRNSTESTGYDGKVDPFERSRMLNKKEEVIDDINGCSNREMLDRCNSLYSKLIIKAI